MRFRLLIEYYKYLNPAISYRKTINSFFNCKAQPNINNPIKLNHCITKYNNLN